MVLLVAGRVVRTATSLWQERETMVRVVWDVSEWLGEEAQLLLVDDDDGPRGHLLCDHIVLYDTPAPPPAEDPGG
ncbi:MAG: hypothetical protein HY744_19085 [Deltaproteobacteria bacterium]|nr:hypothetical protein [Deltaproteobacteria bacterium]